MMATLLLASAEHLSKPDCAGKTGPSCPLGLDIARHAAGSSLRAATGADADANRQANSMSQFRIIHKAGLPASQRARF